MSLRKESFKFQISVSCYLAHIHGKQKQGYWNLFHGISLSKGTGRTDTSEQILGSQCSNVNFKLLKLPHRFNRTHNDMLWLRQQGLQCQASDQRFCAEWMDPIWIHEGPNLSLWFIFHLI